MRPGLDESLPYPDSHRADKGEPEHIPRGLTPTALHEPVVGHDEQEQISDGQQDCPDPARQQISPADSPAGQMPDPRGENMSPYGPAPERNRQARTQQRD